MGAAPQSQRSLHPSLWLRDPEPERMEGTGGLGGAKLGVQNSGCGGGLARCVLPWLTAGMAGVSIAQWGLEGLTVGVLFLGG